MRLLRSPLGILCALALLLCPQGLAQTASPLSLEPESAEIAVPPPVAPDILRVVSFNVHHGDDLPALLRSLRTHAELCAADVFLLQEIESFPLEGKSRARRLAEALGLNYVYAPARLKEAGDGTHGLAVLSRFPLTSIEVIPLKQYNLGVNTRRRIALGVTVEVGARKLRVYNVHLDTRINARQRIEQLQPVLEAAGAAPADAVVVGGDFNTNPLYWLLPVLPLFRSNQAKAVDDHMKKSGFTTPFSETGGTMKKWGGRYRVDAIYSRGVGLRGSGVEEGVTVSDHFPIWVDVAWPEKPEQKAGSSSAPRAGNRFGMTSFGTWVGVAQALLPVLNSAHKHGRTARSGCATYTERLRHVSR